MMARPKKEVKRINKVSISCTQKEKNTIEFYAKQAGLSASEYSRLKAMRKTVITTEMKEKINELIRISNNLNQLTKKMNSTQDHQRILKLRNEVFDLIDTLEL